MYRASRYRLYSDQAQARTFFMEGPVETACDAADPSQRTSYIDPRDIPA